MEIGNPLPEEMHDRVAACWHPSINWQFSHALDFKSCLSDFKRWGLLIDSLGSSFTGLVVSMVITFSLDIGGRLMLVVGQSLGMEERALSLDVEVRGLSRLSLDMEVRGGLSGLSLDMKVRGGLSGLSLDVEVRGGLSGLSLDVEMRGGFVRIVTGYGDERRICQDCHWLWR